MIKISQPEISAEEIKAVNEVLQSGILAQGPRVAQLEEDFAKFCGTKYAVAVSSGTAALHAALHAAGVGKGDEVITTPYSFIATVNTILMVGAKPIFVDINPITFNLDETKIKKVITDKTKAILPVHLYGQNVEYSTINDIAKKYNLKVIEDACQAIGAEYNGKKAGNLGDLGCFSLYATKNIMSGEGGIVTTNNEEYVSRIKSFRQHGMSAQYVYEELGYNYRMTDLQAAIAIEQLKKVSKFTAKRQENAKLLSKGLSDITGLTIPKVAKDRNHVFHQYVIRINDEFAMSRDKLVEFLRSRDIGAGVYYPNGLHTCPHITKFGYKLGDFPETERAAKEVIALPVHPALTGEDIQQIVKVIREAGKC
jgi:perosamine synthetase